MATRCVEPKADGLVLFNRYLQPDLDLVRLSLSGELELSTPSEIRLPLLWTALLAGQVTASLAASTGVEHSDEVVKYVLAGVDVVMTTAAILRHGPGYVRTVLADVAIWLEVGRLDSLDRIRGQLS
jgi:dihydroorotate dehydrogenase (fumarate)